MAACQCMPAPLKRMSAVAAAFCRLVPPAVAFRMHSAPCHLQAGWVFNILLAVALVVWHVAPLPAGVLVLRAMSTISALMQQIDELLHLAQAEAAAAQQASQELHALRQWAAAQGLQLFAGHEGESEGEQVQDPPPGQAEHGQHAAAGELADRAGQLVADVLHAMHEARPLDTVAR